MPDLLILAAALACASVISGLTGFAFALVASGMLLTIRPPVEAATLVLLCSIMSQLIALARLRVRPPMRVVAAMVVPGLLGAPIGVYLLHDLDPETVRLCVGVFLVLYAAFMALISPSYKVSFGNAWTDGTVGFFGGILGGIGGLSGALPTAWSLVRGWDHRVQRSIYQSYTLALQIWSLTIIAFSDKFPRSLIVDLVVAVPVVVAGVLFGLSLFSRIDQVTFRRVVLCLLALLGLVTTGMAVRALIRPAADHQAAGPAPVLHEGSPTRPIARQLGANDLGNKTFPPRRDRYGNALRVRDGAPSLSFLQ